MDYVIDNIEAFNQALAAKMPTIVVNIKIVDDKLSIIKSIGEQTHDNHHTLIF